MKIIFLSLVSMFLISGVAHAGRVEIAPSGNKVTKEGVVSVYASWVKDKSNKYDLGFSMKNESQKPMIVLFSEMHCFRGGMEGELKHTFFNTGDKTIDFRAGELRNFTLVCNLSGEIKGDYRITIGRVYENGSGDTKTIGKVIAKDIEWKVRIAE